METLIIATDYSAPSQNATWYAAALANRIQAKLVLYHAFYYQETSSKAWVDVPTLEELTEEHQSRLGAIKQQIQQSYPLQVDCAVSPNPLEESLPRLVSTYPDAVVVMGMKKGSLFDRKIFGSVAASAISLAAFPILMIPEKAAFHQLQNILFAFNFELIQNNSLVFLTKLALAFQASVHLIHVEKAERDSEAGVGRRSSYKSSIEEALQEVPHQYIFLEDEDMAEGINKAIIEYQAELLVMVPRKHGVWDRIMNESLTTKLAFQSHIPLLTLPNPLTKE